MKGKDLIEAARDKITEEDLEYATKVVAEVERIVQRAERDVRKAKKRLIEVLGMTIDEIFEYAEKSGYGRNL